MTQKYIEETEQGYWLKGTRISLDSIILAFQDGLSPETIATDCFPTLTLEQVYGAITYYLAHQEKMNLYLQKSDKEWSQLREDAIA
jgi:uncharacterized protein (DUF433 family)